MAGSFSGFVLPLRAKPQTLQVPLLGVTYNLRTRWSIGLQCWCLDIADSSGAQLAGQIPLVTGADLLEQYGYLEIGGGLWVQDTTLPPNAVPGFTDLGVTARVLFVPYTAIAAAA